MILKSSSIIAALSVLFSCNDQTPEPAASKQPPIKTSTLSCYRYINKKDTVILNTNNINDSVTGTLVYDFYEKDKNMGTIRGKMKGELLIADYTFNSEGARSVRQVAFERSGNTFIEGYGDIEDKNGKATFINLDSLDFSHSIILSKVDCDAQ